MSAQRDFIWVNPTLEQLAAQVAQQRGLTVAQMRSRSQELPLVDARCEFWWRARRETKASYPRIAGYMRRKCHTTAMNGVKRHGAKLAADAIDSDGKNHLSTDKSSLSRVQSNSDPQVRGMICP